MLLFTNIYLLFRFLVKDELFHKNPIEKHLRVSKLRTYNVDKPIINPLIHLLKPVNFTYVKQCSQPKLSLQHDTLAFAFQNLEPLQCFGSNFFSLQKGFLVPNKTALADRKIKACNVIAIQRNTDALSKEMKLFTVYSETNKYLVENDFIYIKCEFYSESVVKDSENDSNVNIEKKTKQRITDSGEAVEDITGKKNAQTGMLSSELNQRFQQSTDLFFRNRHLLSDFTHAVSKSGKGNIQSLRIGHSNNVTAKQSSKVTTRLQSNKFELSHVSYNKHIVNLKKSKGSIKKVSKKDIFLSPKIKLDMTTRSFAVKMNSTQHYQWAKDLEFSDKSSRMWNSRPSPVEPKVSPLFTAVTSNFLDDEWLPSEYSVDDKQQFYGWHDEVYGEHLSCEEEQFIVQVSPLKNVFERSRKAFRPKTSTGLNVLMFGIDSMSSLTFKRKLPQTLHYLENVLESVVYEGYNIVGDGTTQAILPIFLGLLQHEIPDILERSLDDLDFIWKHYKNQGYVTMFAEDEPHLGVFNLRLKGFEEMPTDHYMRYFWQFQRESHLHSYCSQPFCTGATPNHRFLLQYLEDFFHKYSNVSRFAVGFSGELSHDEINPSQYLDADLKEFLERLKAKGHLRNTALIVFSDHGSRRGKVRRTLQGKIEERLPFFAIYFPPSFRKKYPFLYRNVKDNGQRLTSPFDVYRTLMDVLNLKQKAAGERGISLLRHIPVNRTCSDAGIDTHWCTCVQEVPVPTTDHVVKGAVEAVIDAINNLTRANRSHCVELKLNNTLSANMIVPNEKLLKFDKSDDSGNYKALYGNMTLDSAELQVTVETDSCHGIFEATVQLRFEVVPSVTLSEADDARPKKLTFHVDEKDISRINTYGPQSSCICQTNPHIMKFCCCQDFLRGKKLKQC
ncbi:hypothetical protein Btru_029522 [Bulinus truncatus]|nr:hypothetical protein Btru_029522 [Bulinus truncatus]